MSRIKNSINHKLIENLFDFTRQTWSKWKIEKRPITQLLEKYFTSEDIEEFLNTGKISRLEQNTYTENKIDDINTLLIDNTIYQLKVKIFQLFDLTLPKTIYTFLAKKILIRVLSKLNYEDSHYKINQSKHLLLDEIQNADIKLYETYKLNVLIDIIEDNLSGLECYVLINNYEEIFNYNYKKYHSKV
ncbi:hypothetical protein [Halarcobacter sp.]|uniref:hypothetical protein n=1 Tax=Halarcobacter sp. TaxID=2321133 RepID=UPI002AAA743D|nr:hypothetical protein [Halarcobacter sp.]